MTESHDYRCWLYHATHAPRIFDTESEIEAALAEGWADSPGKAAEAIGAAVLKDKAADLSPVTEAPPDPVEATRMALKAMHTLDALGLMREPGPVPEAPTPDAPKPAGKSKSQAKRLETQIKAKAKDLANSRT